MHVTREPETLLRAMMVSDASRREPCGARANPNPSSSPNPSRIRIRIRSPSPSRSPGPDPNPRCERLARHAWLERASISEPEICTEHQKAGELEVPARSP